MPVTVEFRLKSNGALAGRPRIVPQRGVATSVPLAQTAVHAVQACAPYTGLPAHLYNEGWSAIRMTFDAAPAPTSAPRVAPAPDTTPRLLKGKAR